MSVCRDHGNRVADRQKTRLMWLVEEMGAQKFRETVSSYIGHELKPGKHIKVNRKFLVDISFQIKDKAYIQHTCSTSQMLL